MERVGCDLRRINLMETVLPRSWQRAQQAQQAKYKITCKNVSLLLVRFCYDTISIKPWRFE